MLVISCVTIHNTWLIVNLIFVGRRPTGPKLTYKLFGIILIVPFFSMYLGYLFVDYILGPARLLPDNGVIGDLAKLNYTFLNKQYLTVQLSGGLGNMMFQYASMYGLSRANGMIPVLPQFNPLTTIFTGIKAKKAKGSEVGDHWPKYREHRPGMFDQKSFTLNFHYNISMEGFFQSWRYFEHARMEVKSQFKFTEKVEKQVQLYMASVNNSIRTKAKNLAPEPITFVGIHVRRGDLIHEYNVKRGYNVAPDTYITKAMFYFRSRYKNVVFVVCSDDKQWCSENISPPEETIMVISPFKSPEQDLAVLGACNHTIITVGTFSWWAAYLAGGDVVYYHNYAKHGSPVYDNVRQFDYFYPNWKAM